MGEVGTSLSNPSCACGVGGGKRRKKNPQKERSKELQLIATERLYMAGKHEGSPLSFTICTRCDHSYQPDGHVLARGARCSLNFAQIHAALSCNNEKTERFGHSVSPPVIRAGLDSVGLSAVPEYLQSLYRTQTTHNTKLTTCSYVSKEKCLTATGCGVIHCPVAR